MVAGATYLAVVVALTALLAWIAVPRHLGEIRVPGSAPGAGARTVPARTGLSACGGPQSRKDG